MAATVEVQFKGIRREFYRWPADAEPLRLRDPVIVQAERGLDFGRVSAVGERAEQKCGGCSTCPTSRDQAPGPDLRPVLRIATPEDVRQADELRRSEDEVRRTVAQKVWGRSLGMRISDAEWQWDRKKLTVYFTAEQRVDFRGLVRELATQYRARIELRQIGVRDEAARLGGVGRCGREFCCSTWLKDLSPVSLSLAKDQHLSLNPAQISGGCGRLLCCLRYEHEFYVASRKRYPKEGRTVRTAAGPEKVIAVDIFRERVFLRGEAGSRTVALVDLRTEMEAAAAVPAPPATPPPGHQTPGARGPKARPAERPVAAAAGPAAPPPVTPPADGQATAGPGDGGARQKKRRRRRRRPGGGPPPGPGPAGEG